jgi:hypothetical protein
MHGVSAQHVGVVAGHKGPTLWCWTEREKGGHKKLAKVTVAKTMWRTNGRREDGDTELRFRGSPKY